MGLAKCALDYIRNHASGDGNLVSKSTYLPNSYLPSILTMATRGDI